MYQAVFLYAEVDKGAESGDVVDDARYRHAYSKFLEVLHGRYKGFVVAVDARVASGLAQFGHNVCHGLQASGTFLSQSFYVYFVEQSAVGR